MEKVSREGEDNSMETSFRSDSEMLMLEDELTNNTTVKMDSLMQKIKEFVSNGSGWKVEKH